MKKVFVIACLSVFVLASCKKDYTCTISISGQSDSVLSYSKLSKTQATAQKSACTLAGGTWSKK